MNRLVQPEWLDVLSPQAGPALRSRRDLRRVNAWMGHPQMMARMLDAAAPAARRAEIVELGAGDGHFFLSVARQLNGQWAGGSVVLVDQLAALDGRVTEQMSGLGWAVRPSVAEAGTWLSQAPKGVPRIILSNLFFHQFDDPALREMLDLAAGASQAVIALEPRRGWLARLGGECLWAIGCGPVTRHDARLSIRAGFRGGELSALWPDRKSWTLTERRAGWFSHLFVARQKA